MKEYLIKIFGYNPLPFLGTVVGAFILPLVIYLILISLVVLADMITGIQAANKRKEKISGRWRRTLEKLTSFTTLLVAGRALEYFLFYQNFEIIPTYLTGAFCGLILVGEVISVTENVEYVTGIKVNQYLKSLKLVEFITKNFNKKISKSNKN